MKKILERLKAAWCVLTHKEYIVFTTTTNYESGTIEKISCFVGDNNTYVFNETSMEFLKDVIYNND